MKKLLSLILAISTVFTMSISAFAAEPTTEEYPEPVIIENFSEYKAARSETLKYNDTVTLNTSEYTQITSVTTGFGAEVITCYNDGPGAVTFRVGSQTGAVNPGDGIQFSVGSLTKYSISAKANWVSGDYPIQIYLVS